MIFDVVEQTSRLYQTTLVDEVGVVFNGTAFLTLTLTAYTLASDMIINGRDGQNVLNANGVTVSVDGVLQWVMTPADTAIIDAAVASELHRAVFTGTWNPGGGVRTWRHEVTFLVRNLHRVP